MWESRGGGVVRSWRALLDAGPVAGLGDGQLLERFAAREGDAAEAAFAALVARHGPMVRRVCRGMLTDPHDADDAFQATFLVLARKARSLREPDRLANWLFGTAHRASKKLRADAARRRKHETARSTQGAEEDPAQVEGLEAVVEEVARLPQPCRVAVVLCDLEGLTQDEAARQIGCSDRTLRRRLTQAHDLLRNRLTRRGYAPAPAILALKSSLLPEALIDSTARAASSFAAGKAMVGMVPASALILANGVIKAMTWTKLKAGASVLGVLLALGGGIGSASRLLARPQESTAPPKLQQKAETQVVAAKPSPAERYKALVKKYQDALKVYQDAMVKTTTEAERLEVYKLSPDTRAHIPAFVALAEEFPADPVAVDALLWAAEYALSSVYKPEDPGCRAYARALEILARDHADEPRVGTYCRSLSMSPVTVKGEFLRKVAGRSKDRVVKGRATLALAEYLRTEAAMANSVQHPQAPINFDLWHSPDQLTDDQRRMMVADPAAFSRQIEQFQAQYQPEYLKVLKQADIEALRRESEQAYARVAADFADVPAVAVFGAATRETLADLVRLHHQPRQPVPPAPPASRFQPLAEAFQAAEKKANEASSAAGNGQAGVTAYIAAAPKWADFGPKMWAIAEDRPRSPEGFDALLWIVHHHMPFFDSAEERSVLIGKAIDVLIRDHLDFIGDHLDDRNVAEGFNHWMPMPAPKIDRIFQALYERGRTREIRGRMGLMLARHRKGEADFVESLDVRGSDPLRRPEIAIFAPSYLDQLQKAGQRRLADEAAATFDKVKADYGDVAYVNGPVSTGETLAAIADREISEIRDLAVGRVAPEILGKDVEGKPMSLTEFRGKVIVLDFGSHEHCGGCKLVYPKQRELVATFKDRPFAVLGINSGDHLEGLKELLAKKEVTWRSWWDGEDILHPGPITTRWNIRGLPTFIVLDHRGVIRFKDLHPFDPTFDPTIEALVKEAEAARP